MKYTLLGNIIDYEFPFLQHFKDDIGKHYLLSWVDVNNDIDEWLMFTVKETDLFEYINNIISLKTLMNRSCNYKFIKNDITTPMPLISKDLFPTNDSFIGDKYINSYVKKLRYESSI